MADVFSPDAFVVTTDAGDRFIVWHIGLIGSSEEQSDWFKRGTDQHARLLPRGTRVWLQTQAGLTDKSRDLVYRHVYLDRRESAPPIGGQLLRAGYVWVFPHSAHAYIETYADRQAEAVVAQSGAWSQTSSSMVFRPNGDTFGGIPTHPAMIPVLRSIDSTGWGHAILKYINLFPVEVGVSALGERTMGTFESRSYSVRISSNIMGADPNSVATVLFHELTHAKQMIERVIDGKRLDCYAAEDEAFSNQSLYWFSLYGINGKLRTTHWLDVELNTTLRQYRAGLIDTRVHETYGDQCAA